MYKGGNWWECIRHEKKTDWMKMKWLGRDWRERTRQVYEVHRSHLREDMRGNSREFPDSIRAAYTRRGMKTEGITVRLANPYRMLVQTHACSFNPYNPIRQVLLSSSFCKWGNQGTKSLNNLPRIIQLSKLKQSKPDFGSRFGSLNHTILYWCFRSSRNPAICIKVSPASEVHTLRNIYYNVFTYKHVNIT